MIEQIIRAGLENRLLMAILAVLAMGAGRTRGRPASGGRVPRRLPEPRAGVHGRRGTRPRRGRAVRNVPDRDHDDGTPRRCQDSIRIESRPVGRQRVLRRRRRTSTSPDSLLANVSRRHAKRFPKASGSPEMGPLSDRDGPCSLLHSRRLHRHALPDRASHHPGLDRQTPASKPSPA